MGGGGKEALRGEEVGEGGIGEGEGGEEGCEDLEKSGHLMFVCNKQGVIWVCTFHNKVYKLKNYWRV